MISSPAFAWRNPERRAFQVRGSIIRLPALSDTGSPTVLNCWLCHVAVTPILDRIWRSKYCLCHGNAGRHQRTRGHFLVRFKQSARRHILRGCVVHRLIFRILPGQVGGQAASGGWFGIRSVPTNSCPLVQWPVTQTSPWEPQRSR